MQHNALYTTRYVMPLYVFIAFTAATSLNAVLPSLVLVKGHGSTFNNYGMLVAAFPLGQFCSSYVIASQARKHGYKRMMQLTSVGAFVSSFFCGMALLHQHLGLAIVCRLLNGGCEGNVVLARDLIIQNQQIETRRNQQLGFISTAITLGFIVGPLINGIIYSYHPQLGLFFPSILSFIMVALTQVMSIGNQSCRYTPISHLPEKIASRSSPRMVIKIWLTCLSIYFAIDLFYQYLPLFLRLQFNLSVPTIALLLFSVAFANASMASIAYLPRRFLSYPFILFSAAIAFGFNLILLTRLSITTIAGMLCIQGALIALISNNVVYYLTHKYSQRSTYLMSHLLSTRTFVSVVAALLSSCIAGQNPMMPFYICIICVTFFLLSLWMIRDSFNAKENE